MLTQEWKWREIFQISKISFSIMKNVICNISFTLYTALSHLLHNCLHLISLTNIEALKSITKVLYFYIYDLFLIAFNIALNSYFNYLIIADDLFFFFSLWTLFLFIYLNTWNCFFFFFNIHLILSIYFFSATLIWIVIIKIY